jgi:thiol:disulfide interchange protein DsbD
MALNFAGLFEFSPRLMGVGQQLTSTDNGKENHRSAFFTGVLACLVASPCTAPFMGTALGFAMTLPMFIGLSIFVSLGLGMASPILLIGFVPKLGRYLPRPGAWMHAFKQFMAFPLLLTVIWLLWVYGGQSSLLSMTLLLSTCVLLGFACWLFQHLPSRGIWRHIMKGIASLLLLFCLSAPAYYTKQLTQHSKNSASTDHTSISEKWTPERFAEAQRSGKPIFVEMTAAWCITCLANEQRALSTPEFIQALHDKNVTYLKGDWTLQDASITTYLASFGRNGVPLYVLYSGKAGTSPQVLPQLLSPSIIQEAFAGI